MVKEKLSIKEESAVPKYIQIVNGVKEMIRSEGLSIGDPLPAIREICLQHNLAQETVIKAYNELKELGIIRSELRKGYFVANDKVGHTKNVFLLFDELSEYKKILYNTLLQGLDKKVANVDVYFHHCNIEVFEALILNNIDRYNVFVIMPFNHAKVSSILAKLKGRNVLALDRKEYFPTDFGNYIVQNFDEAVYDCLQLARDRIRNYKKFTLVFSDTKLIASNAAKAPREIKKGFSRFCKENGITHEIVSGVDNVNSGEAFFVIDDLDMVEIITLARDAGLKLGKDCGLISYNDSPIKRVVADGITVISTDFEQLGRKAVSYILDGPQEVKEEVKTKLIVRDSL